MLYLTLDKTSFNYDNTKDSTAKTNGLVSADELTAGTWSGIFNFNVNTEIVLGPGLYDEHDVMTMSWDELLENTELSVMEDGTLTSDNGAGSYSSTRTNLQALTGKLVIPNNVKAIGNYAFYNCTGLTSIIIPEGVTSICQNAFDSCRGLTLITIPDSVTSIDDSAFTGCSELTSVTIPDGVIYWSWYFL